MINLETFIAKYNSDKNGHGYSKVYESIFKNFKNEPINLLEIGIGTMIPGAHSTMVHVYGENGNYKPGASLRAFRDYFPNGNIYGGDVQLDCMFSEERINTLLFNSLIKEECDNALKDLQFNIIIDDGDHTNSSQETTFRNLWSRVKPGGYYFIEDVSEYGSDSFYYRWPEMMKDILEGVICWDKTSTPWIVGPKLLVFIKPTL
jgi:hypothetical protein